MASNPRPYFSIDQYIAALKAGDATLEYWDGDILLMSGGKRAHARIAGNVYGLLDRALGDGPCEAFTEDQAIDTPTEPPWRFPDASVACGPEYRTFSGIDVLVNPVLIVEVLSDTSRSFDLGRKFEAYKTIPSFREYLLIEQKERRVVRWIKESSLWRSALTTDPAGVIQLVSIECELKMAEIYRRVKA